jgi:hypothetical protein
MAFCYDFDGTLAPGCMQEYDFIPAIGVSPETFWAESAALAKSSDADPILAYMRLMLQKAKTAGVRVTRKDFRRFGSTLKYFPGVELWFDRISSYARERGVEALHYVVSSGIREMIEGCSIAGKFTRIYASGYMYDEEGEAVWPALAVNYTTKTQFLFRINKGSLEVYDGAGINAFMPKSERPFPFSNIIYIGDGDTDVPCFRLVRAEGGSAIAVYPPDSPTAFTRAERLVGDGRVDLAAPADYREGSALDTSIKAMIDRIGATAKLVELP